MSTSLVAYFSATGVTGAVARHLAQVAGADLFEIVPEVAYTTSDLDWTDPASRSTLEMKDPSTRPAIAGRIENMTSYTTLYLGFPIWWYVAPHIINTFLEQYDLSGKTIVLFATSGGSGFGNTCAALKVSARADVNLIEGEVLNGPCSDARLAHVVEAARM